MTRSFSEPLPHGGRLLLALVVALVGFAWCAAEPAGACSPDNWPENICGTSTTAPPETTTTIEVEETTTTVPATTTSLPPGETTAPPIPSSTTTSAVVPSTPVPPGESSELPRTGGSGWLALAGAVLLAAGSLVVIIAEKRRGTWRGYW